MKTADTVQRDVAPDAVERNDALFDDDAAIDTRASGVEPGAWRPREYCGRRRAAARTSDGTRAAASRISAGGTSMASSSASNRRGIALSASSPPRRTSFTIFATRLGRGVARTSRGQERPHGASIAGINDGQHLFRPRSC